jgi:hypothetical protein
VEYCDSAFIVVQSVAVVTVLRLPVLEAVLTAVSFGLSRSLCAHAIIAT